jgi:ribosomal protein S18 acetylase RimI-like enzyme
VRIALKESNPMAIEILEAVSERDLRSFIRFPFDLYRKSPYWVPPLIAEELLTLSRERNPTFETCTARYWLARREGKVVGRIAGIINNAYIKKWGYRYARFGWIDFVDDREVSGALFETLERWALSEGMAAVHGPLGFTDMDHEGMLVEGFDELGTMAALYNYPYYPVHTESRGYSKEADWVEYEIKVPATIPEKAERIAQITAGRRGVHVLDAKKPKDFLPYAHQIFDVINETYADLFSFTPLTETQITYYTKLYFPNIVADYVKLLLDGQNRVAGFVIAMPSLSRALQKARGRLFPFGFMHLLIALKRPKYIDLYLGAVRRDLQGKGVDALLMSELARTCIRNHIISAESNLELEENKLVQALWRNFERRQHKRRRCYLKHLS